MIGYLREIVICLMTLYPSQELDNENMEIMHWKHGNSHLASEKPSTAVNFFPPNQNRENKLDGDTITAQRYGIK